MLLSQSLETRYAAELAREHLAGYLLKDRVLDVGTLVDPLERLAAGGARPGGRPSPHGPWRQGPACTLSEREQQVLALMAQGRSNGAISRELVLNEKTVETHISTIFTKLKLLPHADDRRRVLSVLAWPQQQ